VDVAALTAFLAPFLPYLIRAGQRAAGDAADALGEAAWPHAQKLWARIRGKVEEKPAAQEAASDVAKAPQDERARGALELQLEKLLAEDPALAQDVGRLFGEAQAAGVVIASGERAIAIGGSATQSVFVTGDVKPPE
jgi:hypothetical protein